MRDTSKRSNCPISYTLDILGDKWIMLIIRDIALNNKHFYKDFLNAGEGIATNVLSDRLKILEKNGVIKSRPNESKKSMKYYSLTDTGLELIPVLIELWSWGAKHDPDSVISKKDLEQRITIKQEIIQKYIKNAREHS